MSPRPGRFPVAALAAVACTLALAAMAGCPAPTGAKASATPGVLPLPTPGPTATPEPTPRPTPSPPPVTGARGVEAKAGWLYTRASLKELGNLAALGGRYPLIAVEADPALTKATAAQIKQLQSGGAKVLGRVSVGAFDTTHPYWSSVLERTEVAQIGPKAGSASEVWANPDDTFFYRLLLDNVVKPMAATGVDGFLLDDVALAEHLRDAADGPCDSACRQGLLDLVLALRTTYPDKLLVTLGGTGDVLRLGTTSLGQPVAPMLDGVAGVDVYAPAYDEAREAQLAAWRDMKLTLNGRAFFVGTADTLPACDAAAADTAAARAAAQGFAFALRDPANQKPCPRP